MGILVFFFYPTYSSFLSLPPAFSDSRPSKHLSPSSSVILPTSSILGLRSGESRVLLFRSVAFYFMDFMDYVLVFSPLLISISIFFTSSLLILARLYDLPISGTFPFVLWYSNLWVYLVTNMLLLWSNVIIS